MNLSRKIFWDVDFDTLDLIKHKKFIIERVLLRGTLNDWRFIREQYGFQQLKQVIPQIRSLDKKTAVFTSKFLNIPIKNFRCYSQIQ